MSPSDEFTFSRFELAFVGYSGSGKTTLIEALLSRMAGRRRIGFVKHDAHRFAMDVEGKDTWRAARAGAAAVFINDKGHHAYISNGPAPQPRRLFENTDLVLAEGFRGSGMPKVVVVDREGGILNEIESGKISNIRAFVLRDDAAKGVNARVDLLAEDRPVLQAGDIDALESFLGEHFQRIAADVPLFGLVLCGGRSSRMGRDKAGLDYHGVPQVQRAAGLLTKVAGRVFVSIRADQAADPVFAGLEQIHDRFLGFGPSGGILSAMHDHPAAAWFVVGCDLPFLSEQTLRDLLACRDPMRPATTYLSAEDSLPEPMCTIFEPAFRANFHNLFGLGITCPRQALIRSRCVSVRLADPMSLDNVNSREEHAEALARLSAG